MEMKVIVGIIAFFHTVSVGPLYWFGKMLWDYVKDIKEDLHGLHDHMTDLKGTHNPKKDCPMCKDNKP